MTKPVMISVSGIRGIVGAGLSPELLVNYASAVGTMYGKGKVMVGRDSRVTGEMVKSAVFSGLAAVGCDPVDLGVCSTPTVQVAVQESDAIGGIVITASHNPKEWNALKLLSEKGMFLNAEQGLKVKSIVENSQYNYQPWDGIGHASVYGNAIEDHLEAIFALPYLDVDTIRKRKFIVAYDCVNGAGGTILPQLLDYFGCETIPLNVEPTGIFAHTPEPRPENLMDLCQMVKGKGADIGFAVDPDVDRLAIVAETGEFIGEEYTVTLATQFVLSKKKGPVAVNLSTTRAVEDVAKALGCDVYRTKVGEIHVAQKMEETGCVIGGEGNGGVIAPEVHLGRDAPVGIALMLQYLVESGQSVSALWKALPQYTIIKEKIEIGQKDPDKILKQIETLHKNDSLNIIDGIKIDYEEGWVHIRKSNTEPIIRVMAEAKSQDKAKVLSDRFLSLIDRIEA